MAANRLTQLHSESITAGSANARVTQLHSEVITDAPAAARLTHLHAEWICDPPPTATTTATSTDFLVLYPGGVPVVVPVAATGPVDMDTVEYGDRSRAVAASLRGSTTATRRKWTVQTVPMTTDQATTIRNALTFAPVIGIGGTWPGNLAAWPILDRETPIQVEGEYLIVMDFALVEAG